MKFLIALLTMFILFFAPVWGLAHNGEFKILREEKSVFLNEKCQSAESCDLVSIEYLVQDYKVGIGNGYSFGTRFFVRYRTKSVADLENYAIVQFLKGCVFETSLKKGRVAVHNGITVKHFGEFKEFKFRDWVIDSIDRDPAYYSSDGLPRHYYYKWSKTGKFPTDRQDDEMIFGRQSPPQPELYISDRPGRTAETGDAAPRAEALQKFIKKQNKNGKKLMGGITIYVNGTWRYNDNEKYEYNPKDLSKWKVLDL